MQVLKTLSQKEPLWHFCRFLGVVNTSHVPAASVMNLKPLKGFDHVEFPMGRRRLKPVERVPKNHTEGHPMKDQRMIYLMRGEEKINNTIQWGDYALQATTGGRFKWHTFDNIRLRVNKVLDEKCMFAKWRVDAPWQSVTRKGRGTKMGGGKGAIDHYVTPIKKGRIIFELGGTLEEEEARRIIRRFRGNLPVQTRFVSRQSLREEKMQELELKKMNQNPFDFKYCAKRNFLGIRKYISPYDTGELLIRKTFK